AAAPTATPAANWTRVQHLGITQASALEPGMVTSIPFTAQAGDLMVVGSATKSLSARSQLAISSVTDTLGNAYVAAAVGASATTHDAEVWYSYRITGGADRITIRTDDVGAR